ncbi:MAG: hypothetical protein EOP86_14945 [Verrucomicrobiaceae bacterium]|nr:MAG: hypothetical protein EOP86_14945 [Verrucomicrobiaceae bacterium]
MKNAAPISLCLIAAVGLGVWGGWEHHLRLKLEKELKMVSTERNTLLETANKKVALGSKTQVRPEGPEGLGPEHAEALKAEQEKGKTPKAESSNPFGEMMGKMSKDPALRDAMKAQTRGQVDYLYRDLMDMLELAPDKRDSLTKLLVERTSAGAELGMSMMSGKKLTPEELKAQSETVRKQLEESDKHMKELLGEADYQKFDRFEKSQPERMQLNTLTSQMKEAGLPLTPQSEDQLMDAMYEERTQFKFDENLGDQRNPDLTRFTDENIQRYQEQTGQLRAKIFDRASKILNPEQLDVFRKSQESQAAMEKMGMEMASKMFGNSKEKSGGN